MRDSASNARWSRPIMIVVILALVAVIGFVVLTSQRDGPGSEQAIIETPVVTTNTSAAAPTSAPATGPAATSAADASARSEATQAAAPTVAATAAPAGAVACVATKTMPGGNNFYTPNAPQVTSLGTGLIVSGTVREAGTCKPVRNTRIQIWLNTARGGEGEPSNRGSVLTDENGHYQLETLPVVPQFGQPHVHIAYDDTAYDALFLRAVMPSKDVPTFTVDFVLEPRDDG